MSYSFTFFPIIWVSFKTTCKSKKRTYQCRPLFHTQSLNKRWVACSQWLTSPCRRVLGEGLKKLWRMERSLLNRAASFSTMYCLSSGETSSPNRAWLSCQICLFTSTAHTLYKSLSAITIFSFFSGTCSGEMKMIISKFQAVARGLIKYLWQMVLCYILQYTVVIDWID